MQRRCKHAFLTIERLFSACSAQSGYEEEFSWEELSFQAPVWQDTSLGAGQLNWIELAVGRIMARKELGCEVFTYDLKWQWDCYEIRSQDTASEDWKP
jgi:hypothetical protein